MYTFVSFQRTCLGASISLVQNSSGFLCALREGPKLKFCKSFFPPVCIQFLCCSGWRLRFMHRFPLKIKDISYQRTTPLAINNKFTFYLSITFLKMIPLLFMKEKEVVHSLVPFLKSFFEKVICGKTTSMPYYLLPWIMAETEQLKEKPPSFEFAKWASAPSHLCNIYSFACKNNVLPHIQSKVSCYW